MIDRDQDVRVWSIQRRAGKSKPYAVRWVIDGQHRSRSFRTKAQADRLRSRLLLAQQEGQRFSLRSGEPESWSPSPGDQSAYDWAQRWVAEEWADWAPRTRDSELEALARFIPLLVPPHATTAPAGVRPHLRRSLQPEPATEDLDGRIETWLNRWVLALDQLDEALLAEVDRQLGLKLDGQPTAANTALRYRRTARACINRAVELKQIPVDPWPPTPRGRGRRKARRRPKAIDVKRLPDPATMLTIIDAMISHQPASRMYQTMTAVGYYAGLRPSEIVMLRPQALKLPADGWGLIDITEADDGHDHPADPKTGPRPVPIPPQLVARLADWVDLIDPPTAHTLLFRTRNGRRPALSNWNRSLKRATRIAGCEPIAPYDCRHTCATTWLGAGVPLGEAALRLGHSVETLVAYYVGALQGDDQIANERIEAALASTQQAPAQPG